MGPNIVGGHKDNNIGIGLTGASVLGGGSSSFPNWVLGNSGTVAGGLGNTSHEAAGDQFLVRAAGGVAFLIAGAPDLVTGTFLASGASGWNAVSSRSAKTDFVELDPKEYLTRIAGLNIQQWRYKTEDPGITHVGPFAEEFYAAFGHGPSDKSIRR